MFAPTFYPQTYYPPRYFPPSGVVVLPTLTPVLAGVVGGPLAAAAATGPLGDLATAGPALAGTAPLSPTAATGTGTALTVEDRGASATTRSRTPRMNITTKHPET